MFDDFETFTLATDRGSISGRHAGSGPAVLMLHGIPQTHLMWRHVAPVLAREFSVVVTDLRGYGASGTGSGGDDHAEYSMRDLAEEQLQVMDELGHPRFSIVGHDRGARCAYRAALDHPDRIDALAVLDIIPTVDAFARADKDFALGFWVWSFLAAPAPIPEALIGGAPDLFVDHLLTAWSDGTAVVSDGVAAAYRAQFRDPARVHAICEQYRAATTHDIAHDEAGRARGIRCPVLALWSAVGPLGQWYDPLEIWRGWADDVSGGPIDAGHFLAEEAPAETTGAVLRFLRGHRPATDTSNVR